MSDDPYQLNAGKIDPRFINEKGVSGALGDAPSKTGFGLHLGEHAAYKDDAGHVGASISAASAEGSYNEVLLGSSKRPGRVVLGGGDSNSPQSNVRPLQHDERFTILDGKTASLTFYDDKSKVGALGCDSTGASVSVTNTLFGITSTLSGSSLDTHLLSAGLMFANRLVLSPVNSQVPAPGSIEVSDRQGNVTISIDGEEGDITLGNADVAEDFDVVEGEDTSAGTVMVVGADGRLTPCADSYDSRLAGVVSGAGKYRPALVLDRGDRRGRVAIALMGKVFCKVDARDGAIRPGDLLTTSATRGHAELVSDRGRCVGAVIGKALSALEGRTGMIPVLVSRF